jgi:hypothetical protein
MSRGEKMTVIGACVLWVCLLALVLLILSYTG